MTETEEIPSRTWVEGRKWSWGHRQWEEDTYGINCDCGGKTTTIILTPGYTEDSPHVCLACGAKYWIEGYQRGKLYRCQK